MKNLPITKLDNPKLIDEASKLIPFGTLIVTADKLVCLNIGDDWIHQLFPLLQGSSIKKPSYFGGDLIGAHISVIYPEEGASISKESLGKKHHFTVKNLYLAVLDSKKYYVLTIESPSLSELRKNHGLSEMLSFKGYAIEFHITIGVSVGEKEV